MSARYPANLFTMSITRLIAVVWLVGGIYILVASRFAPGVFGAVTAAFGMPAGAGILMNKRWSIWPAMTLCLCWACMACLFFVWGSGMSLSNVSLLVGAVGCASSVWEWHRSRRPPRLIVVLADRTAGG